MVVSNLGRGHFELGNLVQLIKCMPAYSKINVYRIYKFCNIVILNYSYISSYSQCVT